MKTESISEFLTIRELSNGLGYLDRISIAL